MHKGSRKEDFLISLGAVERGGRDKLVSWLKKTAFFEQPASSRYHSAYPGGLVDHSIGVYNYLIDLVGDTGVLIPDESLVIAGLLHDVCKHDRYVVDESMSHGYALSGTRKGHASLSISLITEHMCLTPMEELMIKYHMGAWHTKEYANGKGEYTLGDMLSAMNLHPEIKLMQMADDLCTIRECAGRGGAHIR